MNLTPFDCRANHKATFEDISPVLLEDHLRKTGSKLAKQVRERGVEEILGDMQMFIEQFDVTEKKLKNLKIHGAKPEDIRKVLLDTYLD